MTGANTIEELFTKLLDNLGLNISSINSMSTVATPAANSFANVAYHMPGPSILDPIPYSQPTQPFGLILGMCTTPRIGLVIKNKTWTLASRPLDANIVRCMWLFRHKYLAEGTLSRYKARLVANGSTQLEGDDVDETFSPVVKSGTIRTVLSLLDIGRFISSMSRMLSYMRSLYGFKQAPELGFSSLHLILLGLVFLTVVVTPLYLSTDRGPILLTCYYLGALNYFLGISVSRDSSGLFLSQKKYALEILDKAHMANCSPSRTPIDTESKLCSDGDPVYDPTLYRSLAGSLQYLTFTRPDISYAVQQISDEVWSPPDDL
ncbi:ribonuclease H-like domain-containing protein [Tanacetum coccineum]